MSDFAIDSGLAPSSALLQARLHAKALRGLYYSLFGYLTFIPAIWLLNALVTGPWWAQWPTLGWGIGLLMQLSGVFTTSSGWYFGAAWEERKVAELMARENLKTVSSEKQLVLAQLRLLQAQIEPHFLFNTLASVQSLMTSSPERAERMMEQFIAYLRQSLNASRADTGNLGQEVQLLENYLGLIQIRMGERLRFSFDVPQDLLALPISPMLLQPVVENAVRHALEPKVEGGTVTFAARRSALDWVTLDISDDGLGFAENAGAGVGLSNLRERLLVLYDGRAKLLITATSPGTRVSIEIPVSKP
jgi:two-component sensor histidine kinase